MLKINLNILAQFNTNIKIKLKSNKLYEYLTPTL